MKLKLNPDQSLIKKINDLPSYDRKSYIARLSTQAINNIVAYVSSSPKWIHKRDGSTDRYINIDLEAMIAYDQIAETFSYKR